MELLERRKQIRLVLCLEEALGNSVKLQGGDEEGKIADGFDDEGKLERYWQ